MKDTIKVLEKNNNFEENKEKFLEAATSLEKEDSVFMVRFGKSEDDASLVYNSNNINIRQLLSSIELLAYVVFSNANTAAVYESVIKAIFNGWKSALDKHGPENIKNEDTINKEGNTKEENNVKTNPPAES